MNDSYNSSRYADVWLQAATQVFKVGAHGSTVATSAPGWRRSIWCGRGLASLEGVQQIERPVMAVYLALAVYLGLPSVTPRSLNSSGLVWI